MAEIKKLQVDGADIYPVTHESAVYDNEGKSIESKYLSSVAYTQGDDIKIADENGNIIDTSEIEAQIQAVDTKVGELSSLRTSDKDNIVDAINELFQSANNGKELIADAIGEPLSAEDTFQAMSNDINGLLSTFKTNMMNNGVTVEGRDKFKQLIDKIANMVEEGEGKGIKFAEGIHDPTDYIYNTDYDIETNLDFTPTLVFCVISNYVCTDANQYQNYVISNFTQTGTHSGYSICYIKNVTASKFTLHTFNSNRYIQIDGRDSNVTLHWYAIGVGEEDTTLRDSLANILQDAGVEVTEEDDMASLISKVDQKFDESGGLDIISATELPATGKEGQICVITDNPVDSFLLTSKFEDKIVTEDIITIYISNDASFDLIEGTLVPITNGNLTTNYYFCKICQGENRLASYIYQNNEWKQLTQDCIYFLEKAYCLNTDYYGNFNLGKSTYNEGQFIYLYGGDDTYPYGFTTKKTINLSLYSKVEVTVKGSTTTSRNLYVGAKNTSTAYAQYIDEYKYYVIGDKKIDGEQTYLISFDISSWTGEYYFTIFAEAKTGYAYITDIALY